MAFDEDLAGGIRTAVARNKGVEQKSFSGGLSFQFNGHMLVGI